MGLGLFILPNFRGGTFIQGAMSIPDSRVVNILCSAENASQISTITWVTFFI